MAALWSFGDIRVWIVLIYSLKAVSCQTSEFPAYIGEDALLPCIYTSSVPDKVTISWRDKDNNNVLDIKDSVEKLDSQSAKFQNRVKSFPDQYKKGNFSIILEKVQQGDAGVYECNIRVPEGPQLRVKLSVPGKRPEMTTTPRPKGGAAAVMPASVQPLLLSAGLSVLLHSL